MEAARARPLIMLVEDDADIRSLFAAGLDTHGYRIETACDGDDALAKLEAAIALPAVIVADLHMPIMDGWDLMKALAADPRLRHIPLIILTAGDDPRREAPRPDTILIKPVAMADLVAAISTKVRAPTP